MSSSKITITGGKELEKSLKKLGFDLEKKVAKQAVRAGANVILKEARLRVPVGRTGVLKKSLRVVQRSRRLGDAVLSVVTRAGKKWTAKGMNAWYAPKVEFGGEKNRPAQPFMRPALDSKAKEAINAMKDKIRARLKEEGVT
jgi:HK97 gp10 family phage protein